MNKQEQVDLVIEQMKKDIALGDWTAINELLSFVPTANLVGFRNEITAERPKLKEDAMETISRIMAFHDLSDEEWEGLSHEQKVILAEDAEEALPEDRIFESSCVRINLAHPWS